MNRPKAEKFNREAIEAISVREFTELTAIAQRELGLVVDGMAGPATRAALRRSADGGPSEDPAPESDLTIDDEGWLWGSGVEVLCADPSWFYPSLATEDGEPLAIVWHYTDTDPGTAENMARRRLRPRTDRDREEGYGSWHVSIEADGTIVQMIPFTAGAWHCRFTPEAADILGLAPNRCSASIELVGKGDSFPEAQVAAAARVARALVSTYLITRAKACLGHDQLDPERRRDPGPVWRAEHESRVLAHAYA